jgi:hypothetical protein
MEGHGSAFSFGDALNSRPSLWDRALAVISGFAAFVGSVVHDPTDWMHIFVGSLVSDVFR